MNREGYNTSYVTHWKGRNVYCAMGVGGGLFGIFVCILHIFRYYEILAFVNDD